MLFMKSETILAFVTVILVAGSLIIAIIDPTTRPAFNDIVKVALGAYMGLLIPRRASGRGI